MTSNIAFMARTCIVGVLVTNKSNMAQYYPEAENLNGINADICSYVAGPSSSGWSDLFSRAYRSRNFPFSPTANTTRHPGSVTTSPILPFGACYIVMHKVYSWIQVKGINYQPKFHLLSLVGCSLGRKCPERAQLKRKASILLTTCRLGSLGQCKNSHDVCFDW